MTRPNNRVRIAKTSVRKAKGDAGGRRGFSLLEVVLALAILTAAVAILGELIRAGLRNAQLARDLSKAELLCESTIYQIESGLLPPQPAQRSPVDQEPGWYYSVENESTGTPTQSGLLRLRVTIELNPDKQKRPTKFSVVRWMRDPSLVLAQQAQQMSVLPTTSSTTSSSSSGTMGTGVF
ncbi:MAG TPA: prepilin-type N-terminal cleavage/methylation domain-containing protein [Pirellulales bacterium]|nr:prepilin-type N-terminal cleavage/methylation domain-containing protein [Pirellulales bacterium]